MSQDQKFQQCWDFRRRDNDFDSSSNDSKSSSIDEPAIKKHKLVSNLILPETDENGDISIPQQNCVLDPRMSANIDFGKARKEHIGSAEKCDGAKNKRERNPTEEGSKKKRKQSHEPVLLDDLKNFMESMLDELKIARENVFSKMREEMKKLMVIQLASRPPTIRKGGCVQKIRQVHGIEPGKKTEDCNSGSLNWSTKGNATTDFDNYHKVLEEKVIHDQAIGSITPNEKDEGVRWRLPVKKPIYSFHHSDQLVSSSYFTLPSAQSDDQVEKHRKDSSLRNYSKSGMTGNNASMNSDRVDESTNHGYLSVIHPDEQFRSSSQIGSKNMGYFYQQDNQTNAMSPGFLVPLHEGLENTFKFSNQSCSGEFIPRH